MPNLNDQANAVLAGIITALGPTQPFAFRGPMNLAIWASVNTTLTTTAGSLAATVGSGTGLAVGSAINSVNLPSGSTIGTISGTNITAILAPHTHVGVISGANLTPATITLNLGEPTDRLLGATVTVPSTAEGITLPAGTTVTAILQAAIVPVAGGNSPGVQGIIQLSAAPTVVGPINQSWPFQFALTANAVTVSGADTAAVFTGTAAQWTGTIQIERCFDGGATWSICNIGNGGQLAQYTSLAAVNLTFGEPERDVLYRLNCILYSAGTINYRMSQTGGAAESLAIGPLNAGT
jgi:hypothetical protein